MSLQSSLHIEQEALNNGKHSIRLTLERPNQPKLTAKAEITFTLTPQEQEELRWYMEDYLLRAESVEEVRIEQIEAGMKQRGEDLYTKVLAANMDTQAVWFAVREQLADLRIEITTGVAEAASIPWELLRDPQSDSAIALRVQSFVRVQSNPNISFVPLPRADNGRVRLLYVVCRPCGTSDVRLRAVANRLLQDLGADLARFDITALRPPTFEQLQKQLTDAKKVGRPFHIVHFDGHGVYEDLSKTRLADWLKAINALMLGGQHNGKHGYILFEHPGTQENMRPVSGSELGKLLHDTGVPVLVLNACQSAMHEATGGPEPNPPANVYEEVRTIGSLAQAVIDQGIPAVLGMRYSVFVVTAAQYIGQLYGSLAQGRSFGEAASEGRKHLALNPDRWVGLQPCPLQDWFVPVVYEAAPIHLLPPKAAAPDLELNRLELDPAQTNPALRRYVPDTGFVGRDETLLLLDRAFDDHPIVLLHAYAGQGKSAAAVEFARWYAQTGGLGSQPAVLLTSFESHTDLTDILNQIGQKFAPVLQAKGIEWHGLSDNNARRHLVLQILRQVPMLWIWNNVESVGGFPAGTESAWTPDEQAELADFLKQIKIDKGTKARMLLTSRRDEKEWLGGIPHTVAMPRMKSGDAASLARSLGSERKIAREEIGDWQPLLDYCNGNPLTLRVIVGQAIQMGLHGRESIANFVEAIRSGEQAIEDSDERLGRDKSLGASLDYGFRHAFKDDELPIIALLHLFQGTVDVKILGLMWRVGQYSLQELNGKEDEYLTNLLNRVKESGLLTHLGGNRYSIHPALPWFLRRLFAQHYDGQAGRSPAIVALTAWVEAIGEMGNLHHNEFGDGNRAVIGSLALEEANLLHARRTAHHYGWWHAVISTMQGLQVLYGYQHRLSEWSRLITEITPDYCDSDDACIPGREGQYNLVMSYRVDLALNHDRDLPRAAALQQKTVAWDRQHAASALTLPPDADIAPDQRNSIRTLSGSLTTLGLILMQEGSSDCVAVYEEAIRCNRRIHDTTVEAIALYDLGTAYKDIPDIRDLDAAEAAYERSQTLHAASDSLGRSRCEHGLGMVHLARFRESLQRGDSEETMLRHAQAAEERFRHGIALCPAFAIGDLAVMYGSLGVLFSEMGMTEQARESYERSLQLDEKSGDRYRSGEDRYNIALMYCHAAGQESNLSRQRDILHRAEAYAQRAMEDFRHYQGCAAKNAAMVQKLITCIGTALAELEAKDV